MFKKLLPKLRERFCSCVGRVSKGLTHVGGVSKGLTHVGRVSKGLIHVGGVSKGLTHLSMDLNKMGQLS